MRTNKRPAIDAFLAAKRIAVVGVSRNKDKTGSTLMRDLGAQGRDVVGVTPHLDSFEGKPCYPSVADLPADVDALLTAVKPEAALEALKAAHAKGIRKVWMQLGSQSEAAEAFAAEKGMSLVANECAYMYCEPVGSIHKFHRTLAKLFGSYQKPLA